MLAVVFNANIDAGAYSGVIDTRKPIACATGLMICSHIVRTKVCAADGVVDFVGNCDFTVFFIWFVVPVYINDLTIIVPITKSPSTEIMSRSTALSLRVELGRWT